MDTRFVEIDHTGWGLKWVIQFPEAITSMNGVTMMWQKICPEWTSTADNAWGYSWETTPEYIREQLGYSQTDGSGNAIHHNFVIGLALEAELSGAEDRVELSLTLTNRSSSVFYDVVSEGGCLQTRSPDFQDHDEVGRSYVLVGGRPECMADLHRTTEIRTTYRCDRQDYEREWVNRGEWFWGRSTVEIDCPAIVGAVSRDRTRSVAIGYQGAPSASQNADGHHCLHSRPSFGDIAPGQSVRRRGLILLGSDIGDVMGRLYEELGALDVACS
jgi:hypothetical protein